MPANCTVYVGNISSRVREKDMRRKFEKYGKIRRLELLRDFAFVDYDDPDDARDAIEGLDGYEMEGRSLQVALARSKGPGGRSPGRDDRGRGRMGHEIGSGIRGGAVRGRRDNCVLVKNLSSKTGWQDLKDWARQCGAVEYADIWTDRGKKYGVIKFENKKDIKYALEKLDDQYLDGRYVRVFEDNGTWTASVSKSRSSSRSKSRSRSRSRSKKSKKSSKEKDGDEKKESKENPERSRSRSQSPDKSNKRRKRSGSSDSDDSRKKKDKRKKKERSQSPDHNSSSSLSSSTIVDEQTAR